MKDNIIKNILLLIIYISFDAFGQSSNQKQYPVIGEPIPEFTLTDIQYFGISTASDEDLKGKSLILDFFAMGCSACFSSLSKTNMLYQQLKDKVNIILVGKEHELIRETFERFRKRQKLNLPVSYQDDLLDEWKIMTFPQVIWIDGDGIVRAVTGARELNQENILALMEGREFTFKTNYSFKEEKKLNIFEQPLLTNGNGGKDLDFTFRSILYPFDPSTTNQNIPWSIEHLLDPKIRESLNMNFYGYQCTGASIWQLFKIAYLGYDRGYDPSGNWYNVPIVELSDPSQFQYDFSTGKNTYNYSIIVPEKKGSPTYIQRIMQQDLERYLGFSATIERRVAPYWKVTTAGNHVKNILRTKNPGLNTKVEGSYSGKKYLNMPVKKIIAELNIYHQRGPAIVDETGIDYNVDLTLDALLTDFADLQRGLKKNGLILEKAEKEMTVIVIRNSGHFGFSANKTSH